MKRGPGAAFAWKRFFILAMTLGSIALGGASGFAQGSPVYKITGVVVSERNGAPVPRCHLTAMLSTGQASSGRPQRQRKQAADESLSTETDASGHFSMLLPSAGSWQLYGFARGFRRQAYDRHENYFSAVVLLPDAPVVDLVFHLEPDSSIAGFVRDEAGEGVRNARVSLLAALPEGTDADPGLGHARSGTMTDDRGHYEFAELAPGDYNIGVQAEPWFAAAPARRFQPVNGPPPDPSLDVVYPQIWFPGVTDRRSAEVISLHHGEDREADLALTPMPATHLRINPPILPASGALRGQSFPIVERVSSDAVPFANTAVQIDPQGQIDVGGLSPGLYRVSLQGPDGQQTPAYVRVPSGAQHSLDLSAAIPAADVSLHFDVEAEAERVQVVLTDTEDGGTFSSYAQGGLQRRRNGPMPALSSAGDRRLVVPSGRYRVSLVTDGDMYLSGMSVKKTPVEARLIMLPSGSTTLNLKLTHGRASVRGTTSLSGKAVSGAMVMLVPATYGQLGSITVLRRDQTNTDGSFLIENIIPGDYILLAIDHGWTINWHDPSTLETFLIHGTPLALQSNASVKQDVMAQAP